MTKTIACIAHVIANVRGTQRCGWKRAVDAGPSWRNTDKDDLKYVQLSDH